MRALLLAALLPTALQAELAPPEAAAIDLCREGGRTLPDLRDALLAQGWAEAPDREAAIRAVLPGLSLLTRGPATGDGPGGLLSGDAPRNPAREAASIEEQLALVASQAEALVPAGREAWLAAEGPAYLRLISDGRPGGMLLCYLTLTSADPEADMAAHLGLAPRAIGAEGFSIPRFEPEDGPGVQLVLWAPGAFEGLDPAPSALVDRVPTE